MSGRKRIRTVSDSSDEDAGGEKSGIELSVKEKEQRLVACKKLVPELDSMVIQDALFNAKWNVDDAMEVLKTKKPKKIVRLYQTSCETNGTLPTISTPEKPVVQNVSPLKRPPQLVNLPPVQRMSKKVGGFTSDNVKCKQKQSDEIKSIE